MDLREAGLFFFLTFFCWFDFGVDEEEEETKKVTAPGMIRYEINDLSFAHTLSKKFNVCLVYYITRFLN